GTSPTPAGPSRRSTPATGPRERVASLPLEHSFPIRVQPAEHHDRDEGRHHPERAEPRGAHDERPRNHEHRQRVEDDEDEREETRLWHSACPSFDSMSPGGHLVTTAVASAAVGYATGSLPLATAVAAGGFLIDLDHAIDYVVFDAQRDLRPGAFLRYYFEGHV